MEVKTTPDKLQTGLRSDLISLPHLRQCLSHRSLTIQPDYVAYH